jgi:hypothetical protein
VALNCECEKRAVIARLIREDFLLQIQNAGAVFRLCSAKQPFEIQKESAGSQKKQVAKKSSGQSMQGKL